jgi:hypothetical protein
LIKGTITPMVFVRFVRKLAARTLGRYPISLATRFTKVRVASLITGLSFNALETVDADRFSFRAIS